jgi:hypothetical protein
LLLVVEEVMVTAVKVGVAAVEMIEQITTLKLLDT